MTAHTGQQKSRYRIARRMGSRTKLWLMASPFIALLLAFHYIPLLGWVYAFVDFKPGLSVAQSPFVGLKYFELALSGGSELYIVLRNTLVLSFLGILLAPLPAVFAILLSEVNSKKFRKFAQTVTTLPNFISWIIVFSISFAFFGVDDGFVNNLLFKLGMIDEPLNVLASDKWAWTFQTAISLWKNAGWEAIIYLAAIAAISQEGYEAAKVDGAGRWKCMLHITIPGILPTMTVLLVLKVGGMLTNGFDQYYVFYNAMIHDKIQVLDYYVYRVGIGLYDYSFATAIGIFKTVVSIILLFVVNGLIKKIRGESVI